MQNKLTASISLILVAVLFVALVFINNQLLSSVRLDLTEDQVYTLSDGSKKVIQEIDEPINFYFYYSDKASKNMTSLRNYANRVESLLTEYETLSAGKIKLHVLDPEPFSENEDQASQYGLTAASLGAAGESIYLGLVATNALDDQQVIAFFDPQRERFLEYEVSKLVHQLSEPKQVHVSILTDLPIAGGQNPMTGQFDQPWVFYSQLEQLYSVQTIGSDANTLPENTDVLLIVHPQNLSESLLYAIDQYALVGGKVMVFVDPHNESDPMAMMAGTMTANNSNLHTLLEAWGVNFNANQVLLDAMNGLDIRTQAGGVTRHFGFVGLSADHLDSQDITIANLELINGASFGVLSASDDANTQLLPLLTSSVNTDLIDANEYAQTRDADALSQAYQSQNTVFVLAARLSGQVNSAFSQAPEGSESQQHTESSDKLNVMLIADTDLLADRFWVQQSNFFGQVITTPFANNGDFVTNAVENLGGSEALISIRSRGTFARPFTKVDQLTVIAEQKFREQEQVLQQQLDETEQQLMQLQGQQGEDGALVINPQQQQAIDEFMNKRIEIRKSLREVRHQLDKDIESLGNKLKVLNIAIAPLVLIFLLVILRALFRTKPKKVATSQQAASEQQGAS